MTHGLVTRLTNGSHGVICNMATDVPYEPIFWDIETTGLNPMAQHWWDNEMKAQVICIVMGRIDNWRHAESFDEAKFETKVLWDGDEYRLLEVFHERLVEMTNEVMMEDSEMEPFLVGWNSRQFDHPYIGARFARKRLDGSLVNHNLKRLDMMRALGNDEVLSTGYPKQDEYAKELGIDVDDEITGADMADAFKVDDWDKISRHGESDVIEMMKVFVEKKEACMEEFYNHYSDIDGEPPKFTNEVEY